MNVCVCLHAMFVASANMCVCVCLCGCVLGVVSIPLLSVLRLRTWARARALALLARNQRACVRWKRVVAVNATCALRTTRHCGHQRLCAWRARVAALRIYYRVQSKRVFEKEVADARVPLSPPTAEIRGGRECLVETAAEVGLRLVSLDAKARLMQKQTKAAL